MRYGLTAAFCLLNDVLEFLKGDFVFSDWVRNCLVERRLIAFLQDDQKERIMCNMISPFRKPFCLTNGLTESTLGLCGAVRCIGEVCNQIQPL